MKKIAFVSNLSWNLFNFRLGLMRSLREKGYTVIFCAPPDNFTSKLENEGFKHIPIKVDRKGVNFIKDAVLFFQLFNIYRNEKPDIVFHFTIKPNIYGSFAAKLVKIRCANTISGLGFIFTKKNLLSPFVNILYRIACGFSEKSFFHNKEDMELFISNNIIIPLKACHVNGSGINSDYFAPMKPEGKDSTSRGFRLLYIGRMLWDKGLGELIEAVKISKETFPKLTLRLVGPIDNGNPAGISMRTIQEWQSSGLLEYLGEKEDVRPFIADSDCVILPSHREGLPRVLLEASAMQKPAIASSIAGCRDIIKDGINGFLCPPKDSLKLAEAIIRMASLEKQNRDEMGRRGRQKVIGEFSENRVIGLYLDALGL